MSAPHNHLAEQLRALASDMRERLKDPSTQAYGLLFPTETTAGVMRPRLEQYARAMELVANEVAFLGWEPPGG